MAGAGQPLSLHQPWGDGINCLAWDSEKAPDLFSGSDHSPRDLSCPEPSAQAEPA